MHKYILIYKFLFLRHQQKAALYLLRDRAGNVELLLKLIVASAHNI